MAGLDIPPALGPQGQSTTAVTSPSSTSSVSQKILTPEGLQAEIDSLQAQKDALDAQASPGRAPSLPTEEETAAETASQEQSAQATPKSAEPAPPAKSPDEAYQDTISQALKGNPAGPDPVDMADREAPRFTSQQLNAAPAMRPPQTLAAAQDEAAADMARQKATQAQAFQAEQARIEAQRQKDAQEAYREIQRLAADKEKNTKITSLYEDMSTPRRILSAIALGFGTYGAAITGGPNTAAQMLQKEMDQDLERKKFKVQNYLEQMRAAGARHEQISRMAEESQKHLLATQQAQLNTIEAQANQVLAPFPQAQQKSQALLAGKKEEIAKDQRNFAMELAQTKSKTAESGHTVSTSMEGGLNGRAIPATKDVEEATIAQEQAKKAEEVGKWIKEGYIPTPDQLNEIQNNENMIVARQAAESHQPTSVVWGNIMRGTGVFPQSIYPNSMDEKTRQVYLFSQQLAHQQAMRLGGQSIFSNDSSRNAVLEPYLMSRQDSPEMTKQKTLHLLDITEAIGKNVGAISKAGMQEQRVERAAAKQLTSAQIAKAPAPDRALYVTAKSSRSPTPTQKAFISKFEAAYGR